MADTIPPRRDLAPLLAVSGVAVAGFAITSATGWDVITGAALRARVGDARVLTDDYAPVDPLLMPYGPPGVR